MKTPKQKAAELIDKFTYWNTSEAEREGIKSALSCVDEIIKNDKENYGINGFVFEYWQEVKQEIEKL
jgi:histidine ammonia-lyase